MTKKEKLRLIAGGLLIVILLAWGLIPGRITGQLAYAISVPRTLPMGEQAVLSVLLLKGNSPASGKLEVSLWDEKGVKPLLRIDETVEGRDEIVLDIPEIPVGNYEIRIKGEGLSGKAQVEVKDGFVIFLETDKPIYKPGQTIHFRILTLNSSLKPISRDITLEVQDGKGIKIFKKVAISDEFGFVDLELPLSTEPNLGVFKASASSGGVKSEIDFRVEEYVLPKYEIKVDLIKEWFMVNEKIQGKIIATYSFGKPVKGKVVIEAQRYVGIWEVYAALEKTIDGEISFELPAPGYVAGVPEAKGMGNLLLEIKVLEAETSYEEKTSKLLTVASSPVNILLIPESSNFKAGLPFNLMVITESPDGKMVDTDVRLNIYFYNEKYETIKKEELNIKTRKGKEIVTITPPGAVTMNIDAQSGDAWANKALTSAYSPSGNFIKVEQISDGVPKVGEEIIFKVHSTREATNFYYEVVGRGRILFSNFSRNSTITLNTSHLMAPQAKLVVWQILPNSEVAADEIPFKVEASFSHDLKVNFGQKEVKPGDKVDINIVSQGKSKVGLTVVDKSVYILAEKKMNLKQVFDELERLYMEPQVELHEVGFVQEIKTRGASEIIQDAGITLITNQKVPQGKKYSLAGRNDGLIRFFGRGGDMLMMEQAKSGMPPQAVTDSGTFAEPSRIRQFFPETWLFQQVLTDINGRAMLNLVAPDSITTWKLSSVGVSKEFGLGVTESELVVFQPFFFTLDLPYSAIRGEEFPLKVAVYNYSDRAQDVQVELKEEAWFDLLEVKTKTLKIAAQSLGSVSFTIRPKTVGINELRVIARTREVADAVIQKMLVEAEGVRNEVVENFILEGGKEKTTNSRLPEGVIKDSEKIYLALTSNYLSQTMQGLEGLLQMPFGCGEQNMILLAPNIFITKYLKESGELKAEIMAKAEKLMLTGYQRQLTYRRSDGSFSAFGESDQIGSIWLTAFVIKTFSQAKGLIYIDDTIIKDGAKWITGKQKADGSFDMVGFVHHQEMLGGVKGKEPLTAYIATALFEAGFLEEAKKASRYLEGMLKDMKDPYTLALTSYLFELVKSPLKDDAYKALMALAKEDPNGIYWDPSGNGIILPTFPEKGIEPGSTLKIETTAYALLALAERGDELTAGKAASWLVSQRNSLGGYGSTQDTVVTLQALTTYSGKLRTDVDIKVNIEAGNFHRSVTINNANSDVMQIVELPANREIKVKAEGKGKALIQLVKRFNLPKVAEGKPIYLIDISYDAKTISVDDIVKVNVGITFAPPISMVAEMSVLDISVPTGFAPLRDSLEEAMNHNPKIKRFEIAGRKVIFYLDQLKPNESLSLSFKVKALYPVKAKGVVSTAYSYYQPDLKGENLGNDMVIKTK